MLERIDHDGILELNMARPPVNALSPDYVRLLIEALTTAPREGAQAIVLSGRPGLFSAGLDVPALLALDEPAIYEFWKDFINLLGAIACSPIPVAAAITGNSPAGGAVMSIYCDYRVMAEGDYRIGVNEVQVWLRKQRLDTVRAERRGGGRKGAPLRCADRFPFSLGGEKGLEKEAGNS